MSTAHIAKIVVGHDGSEGSAVATRWAGQLAAQLDAEVVVVQGYNPLDDLGRTDPPGDLASLEHLARERLSTVHCAPLRDLGVRHRALLVENQGVAAVADTAAIEQADLVVVGSHGETGWRARILGSTATKLPHVLHCPLTVVPQPEPT